MQTLEQPLLVPTGSIRTFGEVGPPYEVGRCLRKSDDGNDWIIEILLIESGELAEYRLSWILDDPEKD